MRPVVVSCREGWGRGCGKAEGSMSLYGRDGARGCCEVYFSKVNKRWAVNSLYSLSLILIKELWLNYIYGQDQLVVSFIDAFSCNKWLWTLSVFFRKLQQIVDMRFVLGKGDKVTAKRSKQIIIDSFQYLDSMSSILLHINWYLGIEVQRLLVIPWTLWDIIDVSLYVKARKNTAFQLKLTKSSFLLLSYTPNIIN